MKPRILLARAALIAAALLASLASAGCGDERALDETSLALAADAPR